jgi:class 3 adenylate cyclase
MRPKSTTRKPDRKPELQDSRPAAGPESWEEEEVERFRLTPVDPDSILSGSALDRKGAERFARRLFRRKNRLTALVASFDIRASTTYMLHLEEFPGYTKHLADFLAELKSIVIAHRGFFDKFTGDGALVFWPSFEPSIEIDDYCRALHALLQIQVEFLDGILPMLRSRGGLLPRTFGLAIGVDCGEVMVSDLRPSVSQVSVSVYGGGERTLDVGNDPLLKSVTVLGRAVVGAVRMAAEARPNRILYNNYPGHRIADRISEVNERFERPWSVTRGIVPTKEQPNGQFAYELSYPVVEQLVKEHLGDEAWLGRSPRPP